MPPSIFNAFNSYSSVDALYTNVPPSTSTAFSTALANATGTLTLTLNNSVTSALTAGRYVYDVELTDSSSKISRILEGIVTVTPEVTR